MSVAESPSSGMGGGGGGVTLCMFPLRPHYDILVLIQPRKTRPCLTERLLMGRKESNQTNKQNSL